jgi:hypothetical protein
MNVINHYLMSFFVLLQIDFFLFALVASRFSVLVFLNLSVVAAVVVVIASRAKNTTFYTAKSDAEVSLKTYNVQEYISGKVIYGNRSCGLNIRFFVDIATGISDWKQLQSVWHITFKIWT